MRASYISVAILFIALMTCLPVHAQKRIEDRFGNVNGVRLHYLIAGKGNPVILLHGYAENSHMWRPLMVELAKSHTVMAPDLRGFGQSSKPVTSYDKKTMAQDIHALALSLGYHREIIVGHDIGLMVAYAYAAQYPNEVDRIVLMDAFLPGVGDWKKVWLLRDLWHFHFYGETPLKLVAGRERIYFEHFWNDLRLTQSIQFRRLIDSFMPDLIPNLARCARVSKSSVTSNRTQKTSRNLPRRS
jgi:pimeloyl-ACP methyl ester carboxylesterase